MPQPLDRRSRRFLVTWRDGGNPAGIRCRLSRVRWWLVVPVSPRRGARTLRPSRRREAPRPRWRCRCRHRAASRSWRCARGAGPAGLWCRRTRLIRSTGRWRCSAATPASRPRRPRWAGLAAGRRHRQGRGSRCCCRSAPRSRSAFGWCETARPGGAWCSPDRRRDRPATRRSARPDVARVSGLLPEPAGYAELLEQLKARVRASQVRAARAANSELLGLYCRSAGTSWPGRSRPAGAAGSSTGWPPTCGRSSRTSGAGPDATCTTCAP